jgi:small redox-active disulfide protein 2
MIIQVLGMGCEGCNTLYENTLAAVAELASDASVEKVEDLVDIVRLGVMSAPAIMIDGKLVHAGSVAPVKKIKKLIEKAQR